MEALGHWGSLFAGDVQRFAAEVILKTSLLLAFGACAAALLGRGSAAARHLVWCLAVCGTMAIPILSVSLPWSWRVLPWPTGEVAESLDLAPAPADASERRDGALTSPARLALTENHERPPALAGPGLPSVRRFSETTAGSATGSGSLTTPPGPVPAVAPQPGESPKRATRFTAVGVVALAWAAGAVLILLHQLGGMLALGWLARTADPVREPATVRVLERLSATFGIKRTVQLRRSARIRIPMTWGVARPVVLLPSSSAEWSQQRTRVVLKHELAHIHRLDALTQALGRVGAALHWFNPLMWWALARLRTESERAADDRVLQHGELASDYAAVLIDLVSQMGRSQTPVGALPLAEPSRLEERLVAILKPGTERRGVRPSTTWALSTAAVAAVVLLAAAAPAPAAARSPGGDDVSGAAVAESDAPVRAAEENVTPAAARPSPEASSAVTEEDVSVAPASLELTPVAAAEVVSASQQAPGVTGRVAPNQPTADQERPDRRAVQALLGALRDDADAEVRRTAAWSLAQLEDTAATTALGQALADESSVEVRRVIAWAIGQIEDPAGVPALGAALNDADIEVRRTAVWALGQIEAPEAIGALSQALSDTDPEVRTTAAWALGQIGTPEIVAPLAAAVRDAEPAVREQSVWALGQLRAPEAVAALLPALEDTAAAVRRQVVWALGQNRSVSAVSALSTALARDSDPGVREQAAWALGQIDSDEGVPALAAALADTALQVATHAAWAIGRISPEAAPSELIAAATRGSGELRQTALWALAEIGDVAALPAFAEALKDPDAEVRAQALNALARMRDPAAIEAIAALLQDEDAQVRAAAARALAGGRVSGSADPRPRPQPQPQPRPRPVQPPRPNGG